jgi:tRNA threonylcarbamoyladenosine biosynthesis protein TsaE
MAEPTAVEVAVASAAEMRRLGARLATLLRAGDLVLLSGALGAGKTTLTQGIGAGLGVRGRVTSPTFVIAREHPASGGGPALLHADGYRLGGVAELDDLDLDTAAELAVTVVEWGTGLAEGLAGDRLEVQIARASGGATGPQPVNAELRHVTVLPIGARWAGVPLRTTLQAG